MAEPRVIVLSFVERGWKAARECSLEVESRGIEVIHVIKGYLRPALRGLIAPREHIRVISLPHPLFWPGAWACVVGCWLTGRLRSLLVDNDRSYRRLQRGVGWLRVGLVKVQQGAEGYEFRVGDRRMARTVWEEGLRPRKGRSA